MEGAIRNELATYRANVSTAMVARGAEEVYCIQYAITPPELAPTDLLSGLGADGAAPQQHTSATLSVRYVGKPTYDFSSAASVRGFQYAAALPAFLSRMVGQSRVVLGTCALATTQPRTRRTAQPHTHARTHARRRAGDETVDEVEEEAAADEIGAAAGARAGGRSRVPYLVRNAARNGAPGGGVAADAGGGVAAASRFGAYAELEGGGVAVSGNLAAAVGDAGVLRFVGGTEETLVRMDVDASAGGAGAGAGAGDA